MITFIGIAVALPFYFSYNVGRKEVVAMSNKVNMTLRMEPELKMEASQLFKALGMDLSTATGIFYRQALRCRGLPFEVTLNEPNERTYRAIEDAEQGRNLNGPFDSVEDLMKALNA